LEYGQFNPVQASSAAAAFAALLAALVLAVIGQVATSRRTDGRNHEYPISLSVGLLVLISLLATTYMFVLVSGAPPPSEAFASSGKEGYDTAIRVASTLFAVCGSALAVGAVATVLFIFAVILEAARRVAMPTTAVAFVALLFGAVIAGIFLVFGYDDIRDATAGADSPGWWWWLHVGATLGPPVLTILFPWLKRKVTKSGQRSGKTRSWPNESWTVAGTAAAILWFVLMPVIAFLLLSNSHNASGSLATATSAVWSGLSLAGLLFLANLLRSASPATSPPEDEPPPAGICRRAG
jgi:hypothetical protein